MMTSVARGGLRSAPPLGGQQTHPPMGGPGNVVMLNLTMASAFCCLPLHALFAAQPGLQATGLD